MIRSFGIILLIQSSYSTILCSGIKEQNIATFMCDKIRNQTVNKLNKYSLASVCQTDRNTNARGPLTNEKRYADLHGYIQNFK